ncbi:related to Phosphatidylinositol N-acetylglucosaminyltransferase subunit GPI1 [Zygosaccharomyces bailii]|nr:related to Phosphatidylinositol N-acetylglucosaminyltransferase subunit GPI1 [Zygosaccharomyces bailii]
MSRHYIFWPQNLNDRKIIGCNESLAAVAIALRGTDYVVLDALPMSLVEKERLESPYTIVGIKDSGSNRWKFSGEMMCIIEFRVPKIELLQFFSLGPISLTLPEKEYETNHDCKETKSLRQLWGHPRYQAHDKRLRQSLKLLNLFNTHLSALHDKYPYHFTHTNKLGQKIFVVVKSWTFMRTVRNAFAYVSFYLTISACRIAACIYLILNWSYLPLVNISVTAQQIDLRCQQVCYFPVQYLRINMNVSLRKALPRFRTYSEASANLRKDLPSKYYPDYIRFYNTLWLMLNDVSFGLICGSLLLEKCDDIAPLLHKVITYCLYDFIKTVTLLLAQNPGGIKLNEELASFLSDLFLWTIEFSNAMFIRPLADTMNLRLFIRILANSSCIFGGTFALSLIVDYFSILSIHIYLFYRISSKIYYWQLNIMISLFYLFCGKKKNILRNRVDNNFFQLDQLLLGTLFFIILVFLTPTVLACYIAYTILRMAAITIEILLESFISLLNHFPLFALLLRLKDPRRIPGGISLRLKERTSDLPHFELKNKPLSIYLMFKPFVVLMDQKRDTFYSTKTLKKILLGKPIAIKRNKLYQILYSSLPNTPIDIKSLYDKLEHLSTAKEKKID